ncbi:hypothetical protein LZ32DRAFT_598696, partial [Colletotrichum eremochloae]
MSTSYASTHEARFYSHRHSLHHSLVPIFIPILIIPTLIPTLFIIRWDCCIDTSKYPSRAGCSGGHGIQVTHIDSCRV